MCVSERDRVVRETEESHHSLKIEPETERVSVSVRDRVVRETEESYHSLNIEPEIESECV